MNVSFFIARKYFLSSKKKNFINIISIISMVVVAFGTMSLIIALSVFNGLESLLRSLYGNFDSDIIVTASKGKSFEWTDSLETSMMKLDGIDGFIEVIEDNVLVKYKEAQRVVRMKGVSDSFLKYSGIQNVMVNGEFNLSRDSVQYALIGRGIQYDLSLNLRNEFYALQIYYPKNIAPGVVNPTQLYTLKTIMPGGTFAIEKYYDENYLFVPIQFARDLLGYGSKRTAIELALHNPKEATNIKSELQQVLGEKYTVRLGEELHSDLYKTLNIEKLFLLITFASIIGIASVNIFFALSMLVIEKKKDISLLVSSGASKKLIRNIFLFEGTIIALSGAFIGLVLGLLITILQQKLGLIGMGMETAVVVNYPVKIEWMDVFITSILTVVITLLASIQPAIKASNSFAVETLS